MGRSGVTNAAPAEAATEDAAAAPVGWRPIAVLAALVLGTANLYGIGVLLPYFVNDLHHLPLIEVADGAGPHDANNLWPQNAWAGPVILAGRTAIACGPFVALTGIGVGIVWLLALLRGPAPWRFAKSLALLLIVAGCVAALLFLFSTTGALLREWRVD